MAAEFKIIKKSYDFCKWLMEHTDKFPKSRRFSMAVRLENTFLDVVENVSLANLRRQRLPLLHAADEKLFLSRITCGLLSSVMRRCAANSDAKKFPFLILDNACKAGWVMRGRPIVFGCAARFLRRGALHSSHPSSAKRATRARGYEQWLAEQMQIGYLGFVKRESISKVQQQLSNKHHVIAYIN